ncbi:MAG: hypothetical protein KC621_24335, partial [Myxococcales bacterium]|nr:hypothetical protein [Myxococcales bacterium]
MGALLVEQGWARLEPAIRSARKRVWVVSPWVSGNMVDSLLHGARAAPPLDLRLVFRWPCDATEAPLVHPDALGRWIQAGGRVECVTGARRLHAKTFLVDDDWAMVGSGNLTDSGMGLHGSGLGNRELAVELRGAQVQEVDRWMRDLPVQDIQPTDLQTLSTWKAAWNEVESKARPPSPPPLRPGNQGGVDASLSASEHVRMTLHRLGVPARKLQGLGRNSWEVDFPGHAGRFKAHVSRDSSGEYHFEVTKRDLELHKGGGLTGLLMVAATAGGGGKQSYGPPPVNFPAIAIVPFDALLDPARGLRATAMRGGHKKRLVYVEP